jgi:hypothetical protein
VWGCCGCEHRVDFDSLGHNNTEACSKIGRSQSLGRGQAYYGRVGVAATPVPALAMVGVSFDLGVSFYFGPWSLYSIFSSLPFPVAHSGAVVRGFVQERVTRCSGYE